MEDGDEETVKELLRSLKQSTYLEPYEKATTQTDVLIIACKKDKYSCAKVVLENIDIAPDILSR